MKKLSLIFFTLVTVRYVVAMGGLAGPESKVAVLRKGEVFNVIYQGANPSTVKLTIFDSGGQEIFTEKVISNGGFIRPYNLSELPKDDYKICVEDENGMHSEILCHRAADYWIAHVAKLNCEGHKYVVAIPHRENCEIEIQVYDQSQQLIYSERQKIDHDFAKIYNLKNLEDATIRLVNPSSGEGKVFQAN